MEFSWTSSETVKFAPFIQTPFACCLLQHPERDTQCRLFFRVSLWNRPYFRVNSPASRGRNGEQANASFKERNVLRRRRRGKRQPTVAATGCKSAHAKKCGTRKRNLKKEPKLALLFGHRKIQGTPRIRLMYADMLLPNEARTFLIGTIRLVVSIIKSKQ